MKKILSVIVALVALFNVTGCSTIKNDKLTIISTSYPGYDFARAITKGNDNVEVKMLLKPGSETHDFEPTPQDVIDIKNSDLFVYVGGESDEWISDIIKDIDLDKTKIVKMMDVVSVVEEDVVEGMEAEEEEEEGEEVEYDEHVWTSPKNAVKIVNAILEKVSDKSDNYKKNAEEYITKLNELDAEFREVVKNANRKTVIFGDRFPLRYFVDEYGLNYYAAFPGCAEQTEASSKTISFLIDKVKSEKVPVVFKIELSSGKIAETIAKEAGVKVVEFNAVHNISAEDFKAGVTYVTLMKKNVSALKEALQ